MHNALILAGAEIIKDIIESKRRTQNDLRSLYLSQQSRMNAEMFKEHGIDLPTRKCICCGGPGHDVDH